MKKKYEFNITEFAKLCNVSVRTLKYYEEIGLFHPYKKDENGYRIYHIQQLDELSMILLYKEYGFSLKEIRNMMNQNNIQNQYESLLFQKKIINEKINQLKENEKLVNYTLSEFEKAFQMMNIPFIDDLPMQIIEPEYFNYDDCRILIINYVSDGFKSGIIFDLPKEKILGSYQTTPSGSHSLKGKALILYYQGDPSNWIKPLTILKEYANQHNIPSSNVYSETIFESTEITNYLLKYMMFFN
ncbi:MAG: MerR family transcriptional regulator [Traorella sp.]